MYGIVNKYLLAGDKCMPEDRQDLHIVSVVHSLKIKKE